MDKISAVSQLVLPLLSMLVIGIILRRKKIVTPQGISDIKSIIINVCLPAVIFTAFYNAEYSVRTIIFMAVIFSVCIAALLAGFLFKKIFKIKQEIMPYLITGMESGMLGYTLYAMLLGSQNLGYFAVADFGQEIFIFTVFMTLLNIKSKPDYTFKKAVHGILSSPPFIAIILGIIVGITGLGKMMGASQAGAAIISVISFMSAPISALILIVIGYGIELSRSNLSAACKAILLRALTMLALCVLAYTILRALIPMNDPMKWALVLLFLLPPPFVLPIFVQKEDEQHYIATSLSVYTLFSIAAFTILAFIVV